MSIPGNDVFELYVRNSSNSFEGREVTANFKHSYKHKSESPLDFTRHICYHINISNNRRGSIMNANRIFGEYDRKKLCTAIKVLRYSGFSGTTLAKWIYQVAFSRTFTFSGTYRDILENVFLHGDGGTEESVIGAGEEAKDITADLIKMTVPTLFGGKAVPTSKDEMFGEKRTEKVELSELFDGDMVLLHKDISDSDSAQMYIFGEGLLWRFADFGLEIADTDDVIAKLCENDRFIVLRPSIVLDDVYPTKPFMGELSDKQLAVIATAESYLRRGEMLQYEDTRFGSYRDGDGAEFRWQYGVNSPEDCTENTWHYSNCAAFCHDTYRFGLGYDIVHWCTDTMIAAEGQPFRYELTGKETDEEKAKIAKMFEAALEPGDIIVIKRYKNNSGHAMLYCGGNTIIHSTGSVYNLAEAKETYEPTVRYMPLEYITTINDGTTSLFGGKVRAIGILRPLDSFCGEAPKNSLARAKNMYGVVAQKLCSCTFGSSVNAGDKITYTFSVYNTNNDVITVDISDRIHENTTLESSELDVDGITLSKKVMVQPLEKITVSYTVCVNDNVADDTVIKGDGATVGGVIHNCHGVRIKRTLTDNEQGKLLRILCDIPDNCYKGIALASYIYKEAFVKDNIFGIGSDPIYTDIISELFDITHLASDPDGMYYSLKENGSSTLSKMVVPSLFGGRRYYTKTKFDYRRTRLASSADLVVGDILLTIGKDVIKVFVYNGRALLDLSENLAEHPTDLTFERLLAWDGVYVVLRPSAEIFK